MAINPATLVSDTNANGINSKNVTQQDILRTLDSLRQQQQRRTYFKPRPYADFMPRGLDYQEPDQSLAYQNLQATENLGDKATALSLVLAQNRQAKLNLKKSKKSQQLQQKQLAAQQQSFGGGGGGMPGPVKGFNIHAPLKNYSWHGYGLKLNSSVAPRFIGFLNALSSKGYKIKSIGTYANRNIAGTNIKSLHSLGLAMDINPSSNPVTYNGHNITNLPPNVGALAAKYGLKWGGSWLHSKRDPMHFSVPYGGRM